MKEIILFRIMKWGGMLLFLFLIYHGCNYMLKPDKSKIKTTTSVSSIYDIDSVPSEYGQTKSKSGKKITGQYGDYITALMDSLENDMKNRYRGQIPKSSIDAINLTADPVIVDAIEVLIKNQLQYLTRTATIDFSVLDSIDKIRYESDEKYREQILNGLIHIK